LTKQRGNMKLGDTLKDKHSGWEGVATVEVQQFNGTTRWVLSGKNSSGEPLDHTFDEPQLELVKAAAENITPKLDGRFKLGDRARDKASGWEGTVVAFYLYMNGCVRLEIQ